VSLKEADLIGEKVGNYCIVELIGHGAMANVYRACDEDGGDVALKIPHPSRYQDMRFVRNFNREARSMKMLQHPNIVGVLKTGQEDGLAFIAMEYVDGIPLSRILEERGAIEPRQAVDYLLQVCDAIQYAHERGVIHRDLKPSNLLVERGGRVVVADFGISKVISIETENTMTLVGTPAYMSPEQCGEGAIDNRTDIYSLGIILYEMITGKPPFCDDFPAAVIKGHLMELPKFVPTQWPPKLLMIARKMLAKSPEQRYPDAATLKRDLELWSEQAHAGASAETGAVPLILCHISRKSLQGAVESALKNVEHRLVCVTSAAELLQRLSREDVRMVLLGHEPNRFGILRLAQKIRESKKNGGVKLILLSHGISREDVEAAFRSGINDIIAEAFDPSVLVSKLEGALVGEQRSIESRRFFRKAVSGKITVRIDSEILDISEGGMRISTNVALKTGETVSFRSKLFNELGLGEKKGRVVWISKSDAEGVPAFQAGIDFVNLSKIERDNLRRWIFATDAASRSQSRACDTPDAWPQPRQQTTSHIR
jgi:serine/threonine protein kinase